MYGFQDFVTKVSRPGKNTSEKFKNIFSGENKVFRPGENPSQEFPKVSRPGENTSEKFPTFLDPVTNTRILPAPVL